MHGRNVPHVQIRAMTQYERLISTRTRDTDPIVRSPLQVTPSMIPRSSATPGVQTIDPQHGQPPLVLIVDDDVAVRDILAWVVQSAGYEAVAAAGADGYRQLTELAERTALVLLDLTMHDMDGFRFRELQLAQPPLATVPTIVLSGGLVSAGDRDRLRASAYVQKPMRLSELRETILAQARRVPGATAPQPSIAAHTV